MIEFKINITHDTLGLLQFTNDEIIKIVIPAYD